MGRVLAIVNVKGGVGKTTTAANLAAALTERGRHVLAVDLDPQASLTLSLGLDPEQMPCTIRHALDRDATPLASIVRQTNESFDLVPSNRGLNQIIPDLEKPRERIFTLRAALEPIRDRYDYILLDCPANAGVLTGEGLVAADEAVVPMTPDFLALKTLDWLLFIVKEIRETVNPTLRVAGCFLTMYDPRTRHTRTILDTLQNDYGARIPLFATRVKYSVRVKDASSAGQSILRLASDSDSAEAFRALAREIEEGIQTSPENELYLALTNGRDALAQEDLPAAYAAFCRATEIAPELADAWRLRAETAPDWSETMRSYTRALQLQPKNQDLIAGLEERLQEALAAMTDSDVNPVVNQAHNFAAAGLSRYAYALYRRATELAPKHPEAWIGCSRTTHDPKEAVSSAQQAFEITPTYPRAQAALQAANERAKTEAARLIQEGSELASKGNKEPAYKLFAQAVELDPQSELGWLGCAQTADDERAAFGFVKHVLRINPKNQQALELYQTLWRPDQAGAPAPSPAEQRAPKRPFLSILLTLIVIAILLGVMIVVLLAH